MEAFVISLKERSDRRASFDRQKKSFGKFFPFEDTTYFYAIDGREERPPTWWRSTAGAWGCFESHLSIIELCLDKGIDEVAIFEDDVLFHEDFPALFHSFYSQLPDDWEQAYLGGQFLDPHIEIVAPMVAKPVEVNRTHAYMLRGESALLRASKVLYYRARTSKKCQVDYLYGSMHQAREIAVYAAFPWLCGQGASRSDVKDRPIKVNWWPDAVLVSRPRIHEKIIAPTQDKDNSNATNG